MEDYIFGFNNVDYSFNVDINLASSGFFFHIGKSNYNSVSFSGISGYIFDGSGDMVGGYMKGSPFSISGDVEYSSNESRLSYYINNNLICNNMINTGEVDRVSFEAYSDSPSASVSLSFKDDSPIALTDTNGIYLWSEGEDYLLSV